MNVATAMDRLENVVIEVLRSKDSAAWVIAVARVLLSGAASIAHRSRPLTQLIRRSPLILPAAVSEAQSGVR